MYISTDCRTHGPVTLPAAFARDKLARAGRTVPWLQNLEQHIYDHLMSRSGIYTHVRNDILLRQGHDPGQLMVVLSGQVHAERRASNDRKVLLQVARPFATLGDASVIDGAPIEADYRAVRNTTVLSLQRQAFCDVLQMSANLCAAYAAHVSNQLRQANARLSMLACSPVEERVYTVLCDWSRQNAAGQWVVHDPIGQQDLAMVVAASREMTSRALAQLKLKGLIWYDSWQQVQVNRKTH